MHSIVIEGRSRKEELRGDEFHAISELVVADSEDAIDERAP